MWRPHALWVCLLTVIIISVVTLSSCNPTKDGVQQQTTTTTTTPVLPSDANSPSAAPPNDAKVALAAPPSKASLIDSFVSAAFSCKTSSIPGLSLAVVQNGQIVLEKGYGLADIEQNIQATKDTKFGLSSITKTFTTTLLAKVLNNTNSSWDTRLYDIFGSRLTFSNSLLTNYGTIRDLAAHRMGIPGFNSILYKNDLERPDLLRILRYLPAKGEFRNSFYYNSLLYGLLAHITELLANNGAWEDLLTNEILLPLNMSNTTFRSTANLDGDDVAKPYQKDFDGNFRRINSALPRHWSKLGGGGSIISSAADMAKWMIFQLGNGQNADDTQILDADMLNELHSPVVAYKRTINKYTARPAVPSTYAFTGYGLGWQIGYYRGFPTAEHSGSSWGQNSLLTTFPSQKIGIYTSLNSYDDGYFFRTALHLNIADILLGEKSWINATSACTFPEPWNQAPKPRSYKPYRSDVRAGRPLEVYTGVYHHPAYGNLTIVHDINRLQMRFGFGVWEMYPKPTLDNFSAQGTGHVWVSRFSTLKFTYDGAKMAVTELVATSFERRAPPTFVHVLNLREPSDIIG